MADSGRYRSPQGTDQAPTPSERDERGRFAPGHPRLGGRRKGQTISAEIKRQMDPEKIAARLLGMLDDPTVNNREVLGALNAILDRTEGKAVNRSLMLRATTTIAYPPDWAYLDQGQREQWLLSWRQSQITGATYEQEDEAED